MMGKSMNQSLKSQKGISLLEVLFSLAILAVGFTGFLEAAKGSLMANKRQLHRQDLSMVRYFILNNFSCEDSLPEVNGVYKCPAPSGIFEAKNHMGEVFASSNGEGFGLTAPGQEPFDLKAICIQDGNQVRVSFRTKRHGINPITGKAYSDPLSLQTYKDALDEDVGQGNDVVCSPSQPLEPPVSDACSAKLVDSSTGKTKSKIPGVYFRDPDAMGRPKWTKLYSNQPKYFAWRVLVKGEDPATYGDDNKPDSFQIQFVLKDPKASIVDYKKWKKKGDKRVDDKPESDQYSAKGNPLPGEAFTLKVCTGSWCATDKKAVTVVPNDDGLPSICKGSASKTVDLASKAAYCNSSYYWQGDIPVSAIQNASRTDGETDWYDSPVDMKIVVMQGSESIASCSTSFTLISPLVLLWPEGQDLGARGSPRLTPSTTNFDLDGDGAKDQISWVSGQAGFLALDLNKNGLIDSGRELFGDATIMSSGMGRMADNGFEALRQYDAHRDGIIDPRDPVFPDLLVWFDRNGNGTTDPWEALPLSILGVDHIELDYKDVQSPPEGSSPFIKARFEARFHGQDLCGKGGCPVYDLYFVKI